MKKNILKIISLLTICLNLLFSSSNDENLINKKAVEINIINQNDNYLIVEYLINDFDIDEVDINNVIHHKVSLVGEPKSLNQFKPELPHINRSFIIPDYNSIRAEIISSSYSQYNNIKVIPSKGNVLRNVDVNIVPYIKGDLYLKNEFYPENIVSTHNPYILRDHRGQVVQLNPFQFNPVQSVLKVYNKIVVKLTFDGNNSINQFYRTNKNIARNSKDFNYIYSDRFLNYSEVNSRYTPIDEDGEMLIICYDSFCNDMDPFVAWKNQKGIKTTMVPISSVGNTYTSIKDYVQNFYQSNNLGYLLLVGDVNQIPSRVIGNGWQGTGESDPWYSYISGNDSYPEFFVGRFSAENTSHVQTQVQRSIAYEKTPQNNGNWYKKGVMIASNEGQGIGDDGEADWQHARNLRQLLLNYTYSNVDELYDGTHSGGVDAGQNPNSTLLRNSLNDGRGILHYTGHGETQYFVTTGFDLNDSNSLTNTDKLPFACAVGCISGNFAGNTCLAESLQRATFSNQPTGTVANFMSTIYMGWAPPMEAQDEMVDILVENYSNNRKYTFGGISFNGCLKMNDSYGSDGYNETDHWTIFGDPSLELRTNTPSDINVSHLGTINPSAQAYEVTINDNFDNVVAALSHNGEFIGSSYENNSTCVIILEQDISSFSELTLTVTGYNAIPKIDTVFVGNSCSGYVSGDMNGDSIINIQDIVLLVNIVLGEASPSDCQVDFGDLNSDGVFNILDVVSLVSIILD
tara:strand:- start:1787 stop:4015 length:2229 start_codon:yes stop_codon:yes gene_type:complete